MKIKISRQDLKLFKLEGKGKPQDVKIEANQNGIFVFSDGNRILYKKKIDGEIYKEGQIVVHFDILKKELEKITENEIIFSAENDNLYIKSVDGDVYCSIKQSYYYDEFPKIEIENKIYEIELNINDIKKVSYVMLDSHDDNKYHLKSVLFHSNENFLKLIATDCYRISINELDIKNLPEFKAIITDQAIALLEKIIKKNNKFKVTIYENMAVFEYDNWTIYGGYKEKYPNYDVVIPKNHERFFTINKSELLKIEKAFTKKEPVAHFIIKDNIIEIKNQNGGFVKKITTDQNDYFEFKMNFKYLCDVFKILNNEIVRIYYQDANKAFYIKENSFEAVIMPCRL
jgi:DNA polymerase-3 subunit beta